MSLADALARRRGESPPDAPVAPDTGGIAAALARRRAAQPVLTPDDIANLRENLPDQQPTIRMPTPPTTGDLTDEAIGQVRDRGPGALGLIARMAPPVIAGTAAAALVPEFLPGMVGSAVTGAAGGALGGAVTRGVTNIMNDKPVFEGTSLGTVGMDTALGGAFGAGTGLVKNLIAARAAAPPTAAGRGAVADLPGYAEAISLQTPLPPVQQVKLKNLKSVEVDPTAELTTSEKLRTALSGPEFKLLRSPNQWAKMAGERIHGARSLARQLREQSYFTLAETGLPTLADDERKAVTVVLSGKGDQLPDAYKTPQVFDTAQRMRSDFYDAASQKFQEAGVKTTSIEKGKNYGKAVDYQPLDNYSPAVPADELSTTVKLRQKLAMRRKPAQALMQRRGTDYSPADQALDELNGIEPEKKPWQTDALDIAGHYIDGGKGRTGFPELVSRSHFFGAPVKTPNSSQPWGDVSNKLYQRMVQDGQGLDSELFKNAMDDVYRPPIRSPGEQAAGTVRDKIANLMLGQTFATQFPQAATPVWRFGFKNTAKGIRDYVTDPSFQTLTKVSGAQESGIARELGQNTVPRKLMETVEGGLRGPLNAGAKPYLQGLIDEVQAGDINAATIKKLQELHLTPDELQGGMTAPLLKRTLNVSADRNQFHPYEPGVSGQVFNNPYGKLATQFQPFGHAGWRLAQEDILEPLLGPAGWKNAINTGDYSLQGLGAARAARQLAAGIPAAVATEATKSVLGLRAPDLGHVFGAYVGTNLGTPGQMADAVVGGHDPTGQVMLSPLASLGKMTWDNISSGHLERPIYDAISMKDPTGYMSLFRPTFNNITKEK